MVRRNEGSAAAYEQTIEQALEDRREAKAFAETAYEQTKAQAKRAYEQAVRDG